MLPLSDPATFVYREKHQTKSRAGLKEGGSKPGESGCGGGWPAPHFWPDCSCRCILAQRVPREVGTRWTNIENSVCAVCEPQICTGINNRFCRRSGSSGTVAKQVWELVKPTVVAAEGAHVGEGGAGSASGAKGAAGAAPAASGDGEEDCMAEYVTGAKVQRLVWGLHACSYSGCLLSGLNFLLFPASFGPATRCKPVPNWPWGSEGPVWVG